MKPVHTLQSIYNLVPVNNDCTLIIIIIVYNLVTMTSLVLITADHVTDA